MRRDDPGIGDNVCVVCSLVDLTKEPRAAMQFGTKHGPNKLAESERMLAEGSRAIFEKLKFETAREQRPKDGGKRPPTDAASF